MKTDVIEISPAGEGMAEALKETERAASYRGLTPKESLRLRLLAEEMMGMLRTIVGEERSRFWVEAEGKAFSLHLSTGVRMNADLREELLKTATSGKNAAVKGFMGRVRDIFTQLSEPDSSTRRPAEEIYSSFSKSKVSASTPGRALLSSASSWGAVMVSRRPSKARVRAVPFFFCSMFISVSPFKTLFRRPSPRRCRG